MSHEETEVRPIAARPPSTPPPLERGLAAAGLVISLAIAAYAQHVIGDRETLGDGLPLLSAFDTKLIELYRGDQSVAISIVLFSLAMVLFVLSLRTLLRGHEGDVRAEENGGEPKRTVGRPELNWTWSLVGLGGLVAGGAWLFLVVSLIAGRYEDYYLVLFFGSLLIAAALWLVADRARGGHVSARISLRPWEIVLVALMTGLLFGLVLSDLTNWRYATLVDDPEFFRVAKRIANGSSDLNLFGQQGVFGDHPPMGSAYQAAVMRVAGTDIFGWKLASVLAVAGALPLFYWLLRTLIDTRTAIFGTAILATSHFLLGYAHTGYQNILPIFPTVLAFALFSSGKRRGSMLLLFGSGAVAGLGFYMYYSSRAIIVILALAVLLMGFCRWRWQLVLPLAAGFVLAVAPMFATEGWNVIEAMQDRSATSGRSPLEALSRLAESMPRVILAFNFNPYPKHFVSGSLLDEISAPLALLGLGYAAYRVRSEGHRFLVIWFLLAMVAAGLFHPRQEEINSRLHYVLPPMAAFAGLALDRIVAGISAVSARPRLGPALGVACFVLVMPAILGFNVHRHWVESPREARAPAAAVVFREARDASCNVEGRDTVVLIQSPQTAFSFLAVLEFYEWTENPPLVLWPTSGKEARLRAASALSAGSVSCVLVTETSPEDAELVIAALVGVVLPTSAEPEVVTDDSTRTKVLVFKLGGATGD